MFGDIEKVIGYKSITEQGWHSCRYQGFNPDKCPYPKNSSSATEWLAGHFKANRGEHWNSLSLRKTKKVKIKAED